MTKKDYKEEIRLAKRMLKILEGWGWDRDTSRHVDYEAFGNHYRIYQQKINDENIAMFKTSYRRNNLLHRLDGPALKTVVEHSNGFKLGNEWWVVNGVEYNEPEFHFFIAGALAE